MKAVFPTPEVSEEWVTQVLDAVRWKFVPPSFDRTRFKDDLAELVRQFIEARTKYEIEQIHQAKTDETVARRRRIIEISSELDTLLSSHDSEYLNQSLQLWFPKREGGRFQARSTSYGFKDNLENDPLPSWRGFRRALSEMSNILAKREPAITDETPQRAASKGGWSLTDQVVEAAAEVFERHLKRPPGVSRVLRKDGDDRKGPKADGPFVRFCEAISSFVIVGDEQGRYLLAPILSETVAKSLSKIKAAKQDGVVIDAQT